jgi:hypothetical protein
VPEILRDGITGYIGSTVEELARAVQRAANISRKRCRAEFESRFTSETMAANYEEVYYGLIDDHRQAKARIRIDGRPARGLAERVVGGEGTQRWPVDLETA